jgi:RNA polymerase sigma-70 factor, ECF subfamily
MPGTPVAHPTDCSPADLDRRLMAKALTGDLRAYGDLIERHHERLHRLSYGILHDLAAAEDAVQETFLKALDRIASYRGESAPQAWLTAIALNVCRHRIRDGKREPAGVEHRTLEGGRQVQRPRSRAAASRAAQHEHSRLLAIAMGYLTEAQREAFLLHYDQGLPYEEVGQILGIRPGAARALAHRAKASLREHLGDEGWAADNL